MIDFTPGCRIFVKALLELILFFFSMETAFKELDNILDILRCIFIMLYCLNVQFDLLLEKASSSRWW